MEMNDNVIKVQQGENFNLDILLSASDQEYIPYLINDRRTNPFFVVTVASTKFEKNLRYVKSWWCNILSEYPNDAEDSSNNYVVIPRFASTNPILCDDTIDSESDIPTDPSTNFNTKGDSKVNRNLYQYKDKLQDYDYVTGHYPYKYFYYNYNEDGTVKEVVKEYECHIRFSFPSQETSQWESQNYLYQITLVSGELMETQLNAIFVYNGGISLITEDEWNAMTNEQKYLFVKANWPNSLQPDIDIDSPLGKIEQPQVILQPTKLEVYNNLRTLI